MLVFQFSKEAKMSRIIDSIFISKQCCARTKGIGEKSFINFEHLKNHVLHLKNSELSKQNEVMYYKYYNTNILQMILKRNILNCKAKKTTFGILKSMDKQQSKTTHQKGNYFHKFQSNEIFCSLFYLVNIINLRVNIKQELVLYYFGFLLAELKPTLTFETCKIVDQILLKE